MIAGAIVVGCALIVEVKYQPPFWAACRALAAADSGHHAVAAALDEVAVDRAAIPSQGRGRPADRSRTEMTAMSAKRRSAAGFGAFTLLMVALFVGLGVWQLQRRTEKHALIAALTERLAAAAAKRCRRLRNGARSSLRSDEFRRVRFTATYQPLPDAMVYSSGSAVRDDISGPGTWAFLPARLPDGDTVAVNAGFVQNTMQDRGVEDRAVARLITNEPVMLTGYLRFPEAAGVLTPAENTGEAAVVHPRSPGDGARARLGRERQQSRRSTSTSNSRCRRAAFPSPVRWRSISRTITCNTPSPGLGWRSRWRWRSGCGCGTTQDFIIPRA